MWIIYSLLGALADVIRDTLQKKNTLHFSPIASGFALNFLGALICIPFVFYFGVPELKEGYWLATIVISFCGSLWPVFLSYALKHEELSNVAPLLALNPILTTFVVMIVSHKTPPLLGWLGILCVFLGLYISRFDIKILKTKGLIFPFIHMFSSIGSFAVLAVALCWSIGAVAANAIVHTSSPSFLVPTSLGGSAIVSFVIVLLFDRKFLKNFIRLIPRILPFSIIQLISEYMVGLALATGFVPYVAAIKRSAIIGSTFAGIVVFKEKATILKLIGVSVTFCGVVLIILTR